MFRLMRNIHLGLGLLFVLMALVFAASSLVIIYRPWLGSNNPTVAESTVGLSPQALASPRAAARELMSDHGLRGDLRQIQENGNSVSFRIVRPGEMVEVNYARPSGDARIKVRRHGTLETLVQLHTNHGLWHEYAPANLWAAFSLLTSLALLLLGATGIYLWFAHQRERVIGGILWERA